MLRAPLAAEDGGLGDLLRATVKGETRCRFRNRGRVWSCVHTAFLHFETETGEEGLAWERGWWSRMYRRNLMDAPWSPSSFVSLSLQWDTCLTDVLLEKTKTATTPTTPFSELKVWELLLSNCDWVQHQSILPQKLRVYCEPDWGIHLWAGHGPYSGMSSKGSEACCPGHTTGRWQ